MPIIETNGTKLEYIEKGQGTPVVFVHGSLNDLRSWNLQMEPFSKLYRAIAYSRRYHYPNAGPGDSSDYSVNLHADDLASFIRGLRLQRTHIVGSSYGAYVALVLATKNPELVRSLTTGELPIYRSSFAASLVNRTALLTRLLDINDFPFQSYLRL
jgi:pimeloyl-ACP methyl ester carboxylesterase